MLTRIKGFLTQKRSATLSEIARHVAADADAVRPMLEIWIRKDKVRATTARKCKGCSHCPPEDMEVYEWLDPQDGAGRPQ